MKCHKHKTCKYYRKDSYTCNIKPCNYCGKFRDSYVNFSILILSIILAVIFNVNYVNAVGTYPSLDPNMVLYYHFNNQSGLENDTYVYDWSGNNNNGTANNTLYVFNSSILNDGSFSFNGINSTLQFKNSIIMNSTCFWIYPKDALQHWIINNLTGGAYFGIRGTGYWSLYNGTGWESSNYAVQINKWQYICLVYNVSYYGFYFNGQYGGDLHSSILSSINKISTVGANSFNGSIDEFIVYNNSLNSTYLNSLYRMYLPCDIPIENDVIIQSKYFCNGTYNFNGNTGYGIFQITTNNITLTGNNTIFNGNNTNNLRGLYLDSINNFNVYNITFNNYSRSILFYGLNNSNFHDLNIFNYGNLGIYGTKSDLNSCPYNNNISIYNNNLSSIRTPSDSQIRISGNFTSRSNNINIYNNYYSNNSRAVYIDFSQNINIFNETHNNNMFYSYQQFNSSYYFSEINNLTIYNLYLNNSLGRMVFSHINNFNFYNNYIYNISYYGSALLNSNNITLFNNTFDISSYSIYLENDTNVTISSNLFNNTWTNRDNWNIPLMIRGGINLRNNNVYIYNNTFDAFSVGGIFTMASDNVYVYNNYFNPISISSQLNKGIINTARDPIYNLGFLELQETWVDDGNRDLVPMNITNITNYKSTNVTIYNNTFGLNSQVYLMSQNTTNLSFITNYSYWFRSYQLPSYLIDSSCLWINNNINNLSYVNKTNDLSDFLYQGKTVHSMQFFDTDFISKFKIYKNYYYFQNTNYSTGYYPAIYGNFSLYNFTVYVSNLTNQKAIIKYGNGSYQSLFTFDNITFNLNPLQYSYVYYNFTTLTEGDTTTYPEGPINIISSSNTQKVIQSNLTDSVNVSTYFNANCSLIKKANYISPNGTNYSYVNNLLLTQIPCSNGQINLNLLIDNGISNLYLYSNSPNYVYSTCYQETANSANINDGNCSLNYGGNYSLTNGYFYINYTLPTYATDAVWQVKFGGGINNYSLTNCFSPIIQLRVRTTIDGGFNYGLGYGQCYNGTWNNITTIYSDSILSGFTETQVDGSQMYDGNWGTYAVYDLTPLHWYTNTSTYFNSTLYEESVYWSVSSPSSPGINSDAHTACNNSVSAFASYIMLLGLLGTVILLGLGMSYLVGIIDKKRMNQIAIISTFTTLILIGVLIVIAIFIFSTLCSTF